MLLTYNIIIMRKYQQIGLCSILNQHYIPGHTGVGLEGITTVLDAFTVRQFSNSKKKQTNKQTKN